jgi:hypothetical protein
MTKRWSAAENSARLLREAPTCQSASRLGHQAARLLMDLSLPGNPLLGIDASKDAAEQLGAKEDFGFLREALAGSFIQSFVQRASPEALAWCLAKLPPPGESAGLANPEESARRVFRAALPKFLAHGAYRLLGAAMVRAEPLDWGKSNWSWSAMVDHESAAALDDPEIMRLFSLALKQLADAGLRKTLHGRVFELARNLPDSALTLAGPRCRRAIAGAAQSSSNPDMAVGALMALAERSRSLAAVESLAQDRASSRTSFEREEASISRAFFEEAALENAVALARLDPNAAAASLISWGLGARWNESGLTRVSADSFLRHLFFSQSPRPLWQGVAASWSNSAAFFNDAGKGHALGQLDCMLLAGRRAEEIAHAALAGATFSAGLVATLEGFGAHWGLRDDERLWVESLMSDPNPSHKHAPRL